MKKTNSKYGSVLVFSLMILFIGLVAALGIASTSLISRKTSLSTGKSVSSFQVADSGAEIILKKIKDNPSGTINDLGSCSDGAISGGMGYEVTFFDDSGTPIQLGCDVDVSAIRKIKSVGSYAQSTRAVEVAIAAGGSGATGGCMINSSGLVNDKWGSGCKNNASNVGVGNCKDAAVGYACGVMSVSGSTYYCLCVQN